ncbi:MAG TPA: gliding motility-associated C-terminal domain-containing protein, partial [Daejeonella sp.]|uniref:Ig-like domain-containing protein n=1 Tax=Daejeonella sp. TaxID=2805397 RepID=UPI002ED91E89
SSGQSTEDLSSLIAGSYTVTVTDSKGCTATETILITQPLAALTLSSTQTNVNCFGESTGAINLTVSGGTAPYSYSWNSGQTTEDISSLAAGSYTVTVTDSKGCTATETILITQPLAALTLSSTQANINCFGESTGAINLTVSGGTAPYSYNWSSGQSTEDISSLTAGSYTVTFTDSKGCTATETILITQPLAALTLSSTQTNINCFGESTGAINLAVSGGTAPYSYSWSSGQSTEDLSSLTAGSYTVTVTDSKGCTATETILITQPLAALTLTTTQTNINCFGESTGAINLTVSGGTAPYSYSWSSGQTTEDIGSLTAGSYTVTVTDSKGCTATETILITQPAAVLSLTAAQTNINCFGESTGAINLTVTGGTAPYSYSWSSGQTTEDLSSLTAGSYTVTVTDSKGCTATKTIQITPPLAALTLSSTQANINCFGESTGAINLTVSGGTAPYSYSWSSGQTTEDIGSLTAGSYTVTVTDSKGCSATETILITQPLAALTLSSTQTNINCFGESTGAINLTVSGGTAPYSYIWSSGQITRNLTGIKAGNYLVTVTDANSCTNKLEISITQPERMSVSFIVKNASCQNTSDGSITANIKGGKAPFILIWNENKDLNNPEIKNVKPGKYALLIIDSNGCSLKAETEILYGDCSPIARDDNFKTEQQVPFTGDVSPNDSDPNNEKLTFLKLSEPGNGKIVFNQDGKFSFQPDSGFNGQTKFTYQICNISGNCKTANVQITVSPVSLVSLNPEISSVKEGAKVSITARLRQTFPEDVFVTLEYSGKAEKEKDYLLLDNYQGLKIPKGSLSTTDKITIAVLNDAFEEGVEDIKIRIKTVSNAAVKIGNGALVTINDVYPPPPITDVPGVEPINQDIEIDPLLSPNGDGLGNEYFTIRNIEEYPDNEVIIFNRWGNELFYIKAYNSSDRIFKGYANKGLFVNSEAPLTDGVYFYIVNTFKTNDGVRTKNINRGYLILKR